MTELRITLKKLQDLISNTITAELDRYFWVTAEISELKLNYSGHCYLELVDKDKKESTINARLRAVIWNRKARFILPYFKTTSGIDLSEGISVLVKGKIEYHSVYGVSLVISDIDPAFTIGDLALKRNEIISNLRSEGIINMNKELVLPYHPGRIAVVSSSEAAGYTDFRNQLLNNPYGYCYEIDLFSAVMQGKETEKSVLDALIQISDTISTYDLVVIVRGGGSQSDLSWFDNYEIAYLITQFPLPVISGIGHDKDMSVTDMVAHTSCKTPTAVADLLIELTSETDRYLSSLGREISKISRGHLERSHSKIKIAGNRLLSVSRHCISTRKLSLNHIEELIKSGTKLYIKSKQSYLAKIAGEVITKPKRLIANSSSRIQSIGRAIKHLSPEEVLKRGYSITLFNDKSIKTSGDITSGDKITTILHKGKIDSEVFDIKE